MFVIIGTQVRKEDMGCFPEPRICPRCRRPVYYQVIREQRWFTAFWIPLFPVHSTQYFQCPSCGLTMQMDYLQTEIPDKSAPANEPSKLQKGARQAGRLACRFKKRLDEMI